MKTNIIVGALIVVLLGGGWWLWGREEVEAPSGGPSQESAESVETVEKANPQPTVKKPAPAPAPAPTPSGLKVLSPLSDEKTLYAIGAQMNIKWQDNSSATYELRLDENIECPPDGICVQGFSTFLINPSVVGNSYVWTIGKVWDEEATRGNRPPSPGEYTISICRQGTQICANSGVFSLAISQAY